MSNSLQTSAKYLQSLFGLAGKVAVVTGGSSGIGREMATALGKAGASIVLIARRTEPLQEASRHLTSLGIRVTAFPIDVRETEAIRSSVLADHGVPDILVNAAGFNPRPPLEQLTQKQWDDILAVNLTAPFALGQAFGPGMAQRGSGRIINVASQQAFRAFGNSGAYGPSKAGLVALTRSQAEAWSAKGVLCNAVVPGLVETPMTQAVLADAEKARMHATRTMIGRNGVPEDFGGIAIYLASQASNAVTGQVIFVDGGYSST
ncbi:short-chain dehydrogenase reductase sdr [Pochonia chlamydosporia 170]|uniref:Short-chain dehydrogenase reductase sdr n=1 Tax=Pochonia chlamydosporia 170 TaxID=1380566 RepID=A0A179FXC3_METCM|nr:short-chain dehydrogenase reductase sdr [Pochonia chlamydosporia 170]OAQ69629.1 short-chain dehydrogenase reductase sdr [Pochonia chlamydosporia 170]